MAPKYTLTYFELTGLGESIRLLLSYGGLEFVDKRISQKDWPSIKPTTPLGKLPLLEFDGKRFHQSIAIARYVAKLVGLTAATDLENLEIDMIVDTIADLRIFIANYFYEENPEKKQRLFETLTKETMPLFLSTLDAAAEKNNGYLANGRLTWADLYFVGITDYQTVRWGQDYVADYPNLLRVRQNVVSIPNVKAYVSRRPPNNYKF